MLHPLFLPVLLTALTLTGCGANLAFPDTPPTPAQVSLGSISGNDYGGHAPIVGAHVFVLQAGTGGYNAKSTSLLTSTYSGSTYPTALDSVTGSPTNGMYYVTTSATGNFGLNGDYTCTAGDPVYLYASGGNPQTLPIVTLTNFSITSNVVSFTNSGTNLLYQGESITIVGVATYTYLNGNYTVSSTGLTTTTFQVALTNANVASTALSSGTASQAVLTINPAIVNMAMLGNCPAGTRNFSSLQFVFMNEVSTEAMAVAIAPFTAVSSSQNDAVHIGTSSTNLAGLQHAVLNAGNLYDIQGSQLGTGGDGDTHIAYATSPVNSNGAVPQKLLNTLGNLLANCVDSANTYNAAWFTSGTASSQCTALFNNATSDGTTTGTKPNDTATAAINIARHPAGEPSGNSTFVSGLFNSISGNVPFQPSLASAPNDFSVGIAYTGSGLSTPSGVAIDYSGDAWMTGTGAVVELASNGAVLSGGSGFATVSGQLSRSPAIDTSGNLWFTNNLSAVWKMNSAGVVQSGAGYSSGPTLCPSGPQPLALAVDGSNNVWVNNYSGDYQGESIVELSNTGTLLQSVNTYANTGCPMTGTTVASVRNTYGIAMDGGGVMWAAGYSTENLAAVNTSTSTGAYTAYNDSNSGTTPAGPQYPAVDQNGKIWVPSFYLGTTAGAGNYIDVFTPSAAVASGTANANNVAMTSYTGGGLNNGVNMVAVDGANNIWAMGGNAYVSEFTNSGTALTPSTGYVGGFTAVGARLAIDSSGSVWLPESSANAVVQMIGVATPVITPLVAAAKAGTPAAKP
jgi:hypothetical protein